MAAIRVFCILLHLILVSTNSMNSSEPCNKLSGFAPNPNSCLMQEVAKRKLRVAFMDYPYTTANSAAVQKAAQLGIPYSCDDPALAVPEW